VSNQVGRPQAHTPWDFTEKPQQTQRRCFDFHTSQSAQHPAKPQASPVTIVVWWINELRSTQR
jgi:hypothetical protein